MQPLRPLPDLAKALNEQCFGPLRERPRVTSPDRAGKTIACPGCWCGLPSDHDWPDQRQGAPHPRAA